MTGDYTPTVAPDDRDREGSRGELPYALGETLLGRYTIFGMRRGGFGVVIFVRDGGGREYAVKTYLGERTLPQEFRDEAAFWISLAPHPNIVRAHFVEMDGDRPLLFLDFIDGGPRTSLRERLGEGPIAERLALQWAHEFILGMEFANARGEVAHLDLKPENLLITRDGTLKITDFGLARRVRIVDGRFPRANAGTWPYAAPELFMGKPAAARSDVYAFGVILYEMLSGRLPYPFATNVASEKLYEELAAFHERGGAHKLAEQLYYGSAKPFQPSEPVGILLSGCVETHDRIRSFSELRHTFEQLFPQFRDEAKSPAPALADDDRYRQAMALHRLGQFSAALRVFNTLLQAQPGVARYWMDAAETLLATDDRTTAREFLERALELDPKLAAARSLMEKL